jgi:CheY-like chemotaxis protein
MQGDAVQLVHCPSCLSSDVRLSRQRKAWDMAMRILQATPLRCRICAKRFYTRVGPAHLRPLNALGRSHGLVPGVLPIAEPRAPAVLVVEDIIPLAKLVRKRLARRGFAVFGAKSPAEALALFQAQRQIDLAVIGLVTPTAGNLDLAAELERLRPGLPVLYLVGAGKTIASCSIEAQVPGSVLAVPFTEEQLIGRVDGLIEAAARQGPDERLWERLIAVSDWIPSPIIADRVAPGLRNPAGGACRRSCGHAERRQRSACVPDHQLQGGAVWRDRMLAGRYPRALPNWAGLRRQAVRGGGVTEDGVLQVRPTARSGQPADALSG